MLLHKTEAESLNCHEATSQSNSADITLVPLIQFLGLISCTLQIWLFITYISTRWSKVIHSLSPAGGNWMVSPDACDWWRVVSSKYCSGSTDSSFMCTLSPGLPAGVHCACVNNCDEWVIAFIQQFNSATKDKIQKQYLLQVEEQHRKHFT